MSHGGGASNAAAKSNTEFGGPRQDQTCLKGPGTSVAKDGNAPASIMERFIMNRGDSTCHAVAGAAGGFMSGIVTCPLDVIKTKLQAQGGFRASQQHLNLPPIAAVYNGMLGTGSTILKEEGLRGLYRGLGPIILGYLPTWAVWFTVYGKSKDYFVKKEFSDFSANFWSSIVAGSSSTIVTNPIWVVKTRMMSQVGANAASISRPPWHYHNTLDAFRKMFRQEGIRSFYSGLTPALLGLTHVAVQFPAYEYLKTQFTGHGMGENSGQSQWLGVLGASVVSKMVASSATYPHEVIRTRLQTQQNRIPSNHAAGQTQFYDGDSTEAPEKARKAQKQGAPVFNGPRYRGVIATAKTILKEEGWRAFYAGMGTNMMRAVPAACTTMLTYEYVMSYLSRTKARAKAHEPEEVHPSW